MIINVALSGSCNPEEDGRCQEACSTTPQGQQDEGNGCLQLRRIFIDSNYMPASPAHKPTQFYTHIPVQHPYIHQKYHFLILTDQWANRHVSSVGPMEYVDGENMCMCQVSSTCRWLTHETSEEHRLADGFIGLPMVNGVIDTMSIIVIIMSSMTVLTV